MKTLSSAKKFAKEEKVYEWIQKFLREGENVNEALADGLDREAAYYYGPVKIKLSQLKVISGPGIDHHEENEIAWFNYVANNMKKAYEDGWDMPPFIVGFEDGIFTLNDGTHRYVALRELEEEEYYSFIWVKNKKDYEKIKQLR